MEVDRVKLQWFVTGGITPSAVRLGKSHKGVTGVRSIARQFCASIDLDDLPTAAGYDAKLKEWTESLVSSFPVRARYWGVARKCLNIFMRDACYCFHLRKMYARMDVLEPVLEVPLDSFSAKGLLGESGAKERGLRWDSIIGLKQVDSDGFQRWASEIAARKKTLRVHLDLFYLPPPEP